MSPLSVILTLLVAVSVTTCSSNGAATNSPYRMTSTDATVVTPLDPNRKVSEQDCTEPVSVDGGALLCK